MLFICGGTPALFDFRGDSAFNLLIFLLGWLCPRMTQPTCLSANILFLIHTADQSLIGIASWWGDGWDRTIKKATKKKVGVKKKKKKRKRKKEQNMAL